MRVMWPRMKNLKDKKTVQRQRKMKYFIEAADHIIATKGKEAATIRAISELACYNSATIYNYFENIDHLIYYTYIRHIKMIERRLSYSLKSQDNEKAQVRQIWSVYCDIAYEYPEIIYTLLFSSYNIKFKEILMDYLAIFSDEFDTLQSKRILQIFKGSIFNVQNQTLELFGEAQGLSKIDIEELKRIVIIFFQGIILRQMGIEKITKSEKYINLIFGFINRIMDAYTSNEEEEFFSRDKMG